MKWSIEVPIRYMKKVEDELDYIFVLAHHLNDPRYIEAIRDSNKEIYLDNSAYELGESINSKDLIEYAEVIKSDVLIIPDKIFNYEDSRKMREEFLEHPKKTKYMGVIQADNIDDYFKSYYELLDTKEVDIIGISRSRDMIFGNSLAFFNDIEIKKPFHLLGLSNPLELSMLYKLNRKVYNNIISIDTGLPTNYAIRNEKIPLCKKWIDFKRISGVDLDWEGELDIELWKENLKILRRCFND